MTRTRRLRWIGVLVLIVIAVPPRFHDLDRLSFYSDEMLTFLSARSLLEGEGAAMPTGMPYHRGLPFTWANAGVAVVLGTDREASYRFTAAAAGAVTPAVLFVTGSAFVSPPAAFVAGTMLALSEWHVAFSRFGRMYSPFLLLFLLTSYFFWRWATEGGAWRLGSALLAFAGSVSLHVLGVFAAQFALLPLVIGAGEKGRESRPATALLLLVGLGLPILGMVLNRIFISATYAAWSLPRDFVLAGQAARVADVEPATGFGAAGLVVIGAALAGAWLGWSTRGPRSDDPADRAPLHSTALIAAGALGGAFTGAGHLWGASLVMASFFLVARRPVWEVVRTGALPLAILVVAGATHAGLALYAEGIVGGVRRLAQVPFPYLRLFWYQFPALVLLFAAAVLWLAAVPARRSHAGVAGAVLAVMVPMVIIGLMHDWGGTRYLFHTYPFLILVASAGLVAGLATMAKAIGSSRLPEATPVVAALAIVLAGGVSAHGVGPTLRTVSLEHGERINAFTHIFPFRPDHQGAGRFVRDNLKSEDVVVAEDVQAQFIYVGRVDYWFRRAGDARRFLYLGADDKPRDIYVNSVLVSSVGELEEIVRAETGRVWFITSGETALQRDWYLSEEQRAWLETLEDERQPVFVGRDGHTRVYCLNCSESAQRVSSDDGPGAAVMDRTDGAGKAG